MPTLENLAEAVVDFASGTEANWNAFTLPIPANVVIYTTDTQVFKRGNGVDLYSALPAGPSISEIVAGEQQMINVLEELAPSDEDMIIIIDNEVYSPSTTSMASLVARLAAILNKDTVQTANMDAIVSQSNLVDPTVSLADDGKMVVVTDHQMSPGQTPEDIALTIPSLPVHIKSMQVYSNYGLGVKTTTFEPNRTYQLKVEGVHDSVDVDALSFSLISDNVDVTTIHLGRGLFNVVVGDLASGGPIIMTASVTYNADTVTRHLSVIGSMVTSILVSVYGAALSEYFHSSVVDSADNIICCGYTTSESSNSQPDGLIVKFDAELNIIVKKRCVGIVDNQLFGIAVDSADNVVCIGYSSEGAGTYSALLIKFDTNLNFLGKKLYSGAGDDRFRAVAIDSADNIVCVGQTSSEGDLSNEALVVKFDTKLNIIGQKRYGAVAKADYFYGVAIDSFDNVIAVGYTASGVAGSYDCLIVKFTSDLSTILANKRYGGAGADYLLSVTTDSVDNIITVGYSTSEGVANDALVLKFDPSLNILAKKRYYGAGNDVFTKVRVDSADNIICVGYSYSEGGGLSEQLIVKFDASLAIISKKRNSVGPARFQSVSIDSADNIIVAGYTAIEGAGSNEAMIVKFPANIPSGTLAGTILTNVVFVDANLTLADNNLTLAAAGLTLNVSALSYNDSALSITTSNLIQERDSIG